MAEVPKEPAASWIGWGVEKGQQAVAAVGNAAVALGGKVAGAAVDGVLSNWMLGMKDYNEKHADLSAKLTKKTKSPVAAEFARVTSEKICDFLKDQVLEVEERDPIVRPDFLKGDIFTEDTALSKKPEFTYLGQLLCALLQKAPQELEKIIEVNLLSATSNIVDFLQDLQKKQPFFLVDLCRTCLQDVVAEIDKTDLTAEEKQIEIMKEFSAKSTKLIFEMAFPEGSKGLILPGLAGATNVIVRDKIWGLVSEVVKDQIGDFLGNLQGKQDLKNMLMIEGYGNLLSAISSGPKVAPAAMQTRAAMVPTAAGALTLAPVGFVFIFFKLVLTSIVSVFQKSGVPKVRGTYQDQGSFNAHLYTLTNSIIQDSDSRFLKFIAKHKLQSLIDEWGPVIVEAIKEVQFIDILNAQCESLVSSVISPGGSWVGEGGEKKYISMLRPHPQTLTEQVAKEEAERAQELARERQVEEMQQELGKNIDGLLHHITEAYKVEHKDFTEDELKTASAAKKAAKKIHKAWSIFANACISRLVKLSAFLLGAKSKIKATAGAFHRKMKKVQQEEFVLVVGDFAVKELKHQIKVPS